MIYSNTCFVKWTKQWKWPTDQHNDFNYDDYDE